jgi:hypothetical protein
VLLAFLLGASGGFSSASAAAGGGAKGSALERVFLAHLPALSGECLLALGRTSGRSLLSLDVSMSRGFGDEALGALVDMCPKLGQLVIFGCTQLTGSFYLGHARAAWRGSVAGSSSGSSKSGPKPCATHPDLPWAALEIVGRPGEPLPPPSEKQDFFFP